MEIACTQGNIVLVEIQIKRNDLFSFQNLMRCQSTILFPQGVSSI